MSADLLLGVQGSWTSKTRKTARGGIAVEDTKRWKDFFLGRDERTGMGRDFSDGVYLVMCVFLERVSGSFFLICSLYISFVFLANSCCCIKGTYRIELALFQFTPGVHHVTCFQNTVLTSVPYSRHTVVQYPTYARLNVGL